MIFPICLSIYTSVNISHIASFENMFQSNVLISGRWNLQLPAASRRASSQDDPFGKIAQLDQARDRPNIQIVDLQPYRGYQGLLANSKPKYKSKWIILLNNCESFLFGCLESQAVHCPTLTISRYLTISPSMEDLNSRLIWSKISHLLLPIGQMQIGKIVPSRRRFA